MDIIGQYQAFLAQSKWAEALEAINLIIERNPDIGTSWFNKGVCLDELNRYSEAVECFIKAQEFDVQDWGIHFRILRSACLAGNAELFFEFADYSCSLNHEILAAIENEDLFSELRKSEQFQELKTRYSKL